MDINKLSCCLILVLLLSICWGLVPPSGNKIVEGTGSFPFIFFYKYWLDDKRVEWIVGLDERNSFVVKMEDGEMFSITGKQEEVIDDEIKDGGNGTVIPSLIEWKDGKVNVVKINVEDLVGYPMKVDQRRVIYVGKNGDLVLYDVVNHIEKQRLSINATRCIVTDDFVKFAVYTDSSNGFAIVSVNETNGGELAMNVQTHVLLSREEFFGTCPLWADIDSDGHSDLAMIVKSGNETRIAVYRDNGIRLASSLASQKTRYELLFGRLRDLDGSDKMKYYLVDMLFLPNHLLGGVAEFFELVKNMDEGDEYKLVLVHQSSVPSYATSFDGNFESILLGDFDGDGSNEIVVYNFVNHEIEALQADDYGDIQPIWSLPVSSSNKLGSLNHFAVANSNKRGNMSLALGFDNLLMLCFSEHISEVAKPVPEEDTEPDVLLPGDVDVTNVIVIIAIVVFCLLCLTTLLRKSGVLNPLMNRLSDEPDLITLTEHIPEENEDHVKSRNEYDRIKDKNKYKDDVNIELQPND